jgi:parallel beta-helix repeat protein
MKNLPRQKLIEIVRRHGRGIVAEPRRCEGLMRDNFPAHRREIAVLTSALDERIPADLIAASAGRTPRRALLARLATRLHEDVAMEDSAARWAVHTWALALNVITPEELDQLERADSQARAPEAKALPQAQATQAPRAAPTPARESFVISSDGGGDFLTLSDAIRRAPAGSRLLVRPGIYNEGLVIDKPLEIVGDGSPEEIIVRATASSCLVMRADAATVRGLTLRGQARAGGANSDGFFAVDIPHGRLLLDRCDISSDSLACVAIHNPAAEPVVRGCRIHHGVDSGVYAFDGARGVIEACDISENSNVGVAITGGAGTALRRCHVHHGADAGIVVWDRAENTIEGCDVYANRRANVAVSDAGAAALRDCRIHDGENTGVFTHRDGRATLEACNIYRHAEPEVAVTGGGDVRLNNCQIHDGQSNGVFIHDAGRALLEGCDVFRNRESGVHVDANGEGVARSCRINDNGHVGVSCDPGGAVEVEGCDLTQNRVAAWRTHHGSSVKSRNNRL